MNPKTTLKMVLALAAFVSLGTGGCDRGEKISSYSVKPKESQGGTSVAQDSMPGGESPGAADQELAWSVPAGWTELPPSQMRLAGYAVSPDDPEAKLTVLKLPPQPLLENVNRWEGQMSLPPTPQAKLASVVKHMEVAGFPADMVDLTSPDGSHRMLGVLINTGQSTWSIKLLGAASVVAAQKPKFDAFMGSIHPGAGEADHSAAAQEPEAHLPGSTPVKRLGQSGAPSTIAGYQAPAGWTKTEPQMFQFLGFKAGEAEVSVTPMPQQGFDQMANAQRWMGQVGATEPSSLKNVKFRVGNQEVDGMEISGPSKRMEMAIVPLDGQYWFIKLIGPTNAVAQQRPAFEQFLKSIQFGPSSK